MSLGKIELKHSKAEILNLIYALCTCSCGGKKHLCCDIRRQNEKIDQIPPVKNLPTVPPDIKA